MAKLINNFRITLTSFIAGFFAVICFHQLAMAVLYWQGVIPMRPFSMAATSPFGIPSFLSASIWGGFWGIFFAFTIFRWYRGVTYWLVSVIAGGLLLSLVAAIIVAPLKGKSLYWGLNMGFMAVAFFVNGCWGLGTAWFYRMLNTRA